MLLPFIDFIKPLTACVPATLHLLQTVQKAAIFPKYIHTHTMLYQIFTRNGENQVRSPHNIVYIMQFHNWIPSSQFPVLQHGS